MSTILDALKRLDDETRTRDAKQVPMVMTGNGTAAGGNAPRRHRVLWIGLAAIVIGAIGWWGYRAGGNNLPTLETSRPDKTAVAVTPAAATKSSSIAPIREGRLAEESQPSQDGVAVVPPKPIASVQANSPTRSTPSSDLPANTENTITKHFSTTPYSANPSAEIMHRKPTEPIEQTASSHSQERQAQPHRSASKANTNASQAKRHNPSPAPSASEPPTTQSPYANAAPLAGDTLQVQAISWSDRPTKRIAVIDGRLLREGQSVNAYQVIQIRPEDVILEKSGKFWKLAFGSR